MPDKMKAVIKRKPDFGAEMVEVPIPEITPDQVLVKVKATSICGTDVHIYKWDEWAQGRINLPRIMGHEFAGEVVKVGRNVSRLRVGDYISAETHIPCNKCLQCLTGQQHICANLKILGVDCDGCFSEYTVIPETVAWKNDPSIPPEFACVQEPLGNAVYCTLVEPVAGKTVCIFGDGPTGIFAAGVARVAGAARIYMVGLNEVPLKIAGQMGADVLINADVEDVERIIKEDTAGVGVDVVLDMAGSQEAVEHGFNLVRKGGRYTAFGIAPGKINLDMNNGIVFKGVTVYGINGRLMFDTWFKVANLLKYKKLDITPVVTHKISMDKFEDGFRLMLERPKISGKVVLIP